MFTLLFGLIRGFFKLIGGIISFIIGFVILVVMCVCFAKACGDFTYDAYQMEKNTPHVTEHQCPQKDYYEQNRNCYPPQTNHNAVYRYPNPPTPVYDSNTRSGYNENASHMFEVYHYIHQFNPGTYVSCPVCHRSFYKNSIDNLIQLVLDRI